MRLRCTFAPRADHDMSTFMHMYDGCNLVACSILKLRVVAPAASSWRNGMFILVAGGWVVYVPTPLG
jgi:hypothetical protein